MNQRKITSGSRGTSANRKEAGLSKRKVAVGVVVILLIAGTVWAVMRKGPDPQVEKIKQMQAELFKEGTTPEQRHQAFDLVRKEMGNLSREQRHEVEHAMHETFERRMDKQMATYFALPKEQRVAYLDKQIDEMEKMRKERDARRAKAGQSGSSGGGGQWQGNAGGQRPPQNRSTDERMQRRDQRLDRTTAQQRAMRSAFAADMSQRRAQRGLPPMTGRGPR